MLQSSSSPPSCRSSWLGSVPWSVTAHWARLGFNVEEEDGFTSFEEFVAGVCTLVCWGVSSLKDTGASRARCSLEEEDDQHLVVAGQVPFVFQDASWTTRENCLKDSVIVSSIAIEELGF